MNWKKIGIFVLMILFLILLTVNREILYSIFGSFRKEKYTYEDGLKSCKIILNPTEKNKCYLNYAYIYMSPEACGKIDKTSIREQCYISVAQQLQNISVCDYLDPSVRAFSECRLYFVKLNNSIESCNTLINEGLKSHCYKYLAWHNDNKTYCYLFEYPSKDFDMCLGSLPKSTF